MKTFLQIAALLTFASSLVAGESRLTITWQPLDGLGSGEIAVMVACHDWYSHSGQATARGLISAPNIPPTNNPKEATRNLNLASACGVHFYASDIGDPRAPLELTMNAAKFDVSKGGGHPRENIIRASLECLRLCLPEKLRQTPLTLKASDADKIWMKKIVEEFNAHDRKKVFYTPPE